MECLPVEEIPEGDVWTYELKLDGYPLVAVRAAGKVKVYSRRGADLSPLALQPGRKDLLRLRE